LGLRLWVVFLFRFGHRRRWRSWRVFWLYRLGFDHLRFRISFDVVGNVFT
jgi:hypothetical protein